MDKEIWKPVVGFEGRYEVSSHGRVKSLAHTRIGYNGKCHYPRRYREKILSVQDVGDAITCTIASPENKRVSGRVHVLMLEAFIGPKPKGMEGCHNDGDYTNNTLGNIRWDTHANNNRDRVKHGTIPRGETNWRSRFTEKQVREIRKKYKKGVRGHGQWVLAKEYGVSLGAIHGIVTRKTWKHIK